jgi:hypothetical protein
MCTSWAGQMVPCSARTCSSTYWPCTYACTYPALLLWPCAWVLVLQVGVGPCIRCVIVG